MWQETCRKTPVLWSDCDRVCRRGPSEAFRAITGEAALLLYEGKNEQEVKDLLWKKYIDNTGCQQAIQEYAEAPLPLQVILYLLKDYQRPYDKINELVKKEELIPIKRGLYIPGHKLRIPKPESFLIANHLWGPSYVSLEKALSYRGFIPERVYEISSITVKPSKSYNTPVGRFSYSHAPLPYYAFGIKSVVLTQKQVALIASPEKAICDKIVMTSGIFLRSTKQAQEFLIDDLRMEEDMLRKLNAKEINSWINDAPKKSSLQILVKMLNDL